MVLEVFKPCLSIKYSLVDYKGGVTFNDEIQNLKKRRNRLISTNSNNFILKY